MTTRQLYRTVEVNYVSPSGHDLKGRQRFDVEAPISGAVYRDVLEFAARVCNRFLLLDDMIPASNTHLESMLRQLEPFTVDRYFVHSWPGTMRWPDFEPPLILECMLNDDALRFLKSVEGLFSWMWLEDLALLRPDDTPWLQSTTHEKLASFFLTPAEAAELFSAVPELREIVGEPRDVVGPDGRPTTEGPRPHRGEVWDAWKDRWLVED